MYLSVSVQKQKVHIRICQKCAKCPYAIIHWSTRNDKANGKYVDQKESRCQFTVVKLATYSDNHSTD